MNRNIITTQDVTNYTTATTAATAPKSFAAEPPAGVHPAHTAAKGAPTPKVPSEDSFLTKILKYVPPEVLGAYLFTAGIIDTNVTKPRDHAIWLLALLLVFGAAIAPYDRIVLGVVRVPQMVISVIGFGIYVFSLGGWFATTTWYHEWYATLALPVLTLVIAFLKLKPLPAEGP